MTPHHTLAPVLVAALLVGCGGAATKQSETVANSSSVFSSAAVGPSAQCPAGGIEVQSGIDKNGNGVLDVSEVQSTQTLCSGAAGVSGLNSLVRATPEDSGAHCLAGGLKIDTGLDLNGNGALADSEVSATSYVCNGTSASQQMPVAVPLVFGTSPAPVGDAVLVATFSGGLDSSDILLADGMRADFLAVTLPGPGVLTVTPANAAGEVGYFLFSAGCAAEADVSRWGPCALGHLGAHGLDAGQYVLVVKQELHVEPWQEVAYSARARFFAGTSGSAIGQRDQSFGVGGVASFIGTPAASTLYPGEDVLGFDAEGRLLLGWDSETGVARMARLSYVGALDASFSVDGVAAVPGYGRTSIPVETTAGRILVGANGSASFAVLRFLPDGTLDGSFGSGGIATVPLHGGSYFHSVATGADGSSFVAGCSYDAATGNCQQAVVKLDARGTMDAAFGSAGVAHLGIGLNDWTAGIRRESDGTLTVYGSADGQAFVLRVSAGGAPISGFGRGGVALLPFRNADALGLDGSGKLLVGGGLDANDGSNHWTEARVARLLPEGTLDATFASGGVFDPGIRYHGDPVFAFDPEDHLLLAGEETAAAPFNLRRYLANGQPDLDFGAGGALALQLHYADDMRVGADRKIYVAGTDVAMGAVLVERVK